MENTKYIPRTVMFILIKTTVENQTPMPVAQKNAGEQHIEKAKRLKTTHYAMKNPGAIEKIENKIRGLMAQIYNATFIFIYNSSTWPNI